ncbi:hypothetical protein SBV1_720004 [Verrucomicrobia bacterium]|nr:hypothetical protein SBV1_720004 [Verrucomicrobiota bacterium]
MNEPLQVLIVEDSENDALLLELELQQAGYQPVCERVETAEAMTAALARQKWDLIVADYVMPRFNGLAALSLVKEQGFDLPFIIVSGHITDDTAVAAMKAGAHDYVMKDNLARLGSAVQRELREAEGRRERRRVEEKLNLERSFREAIENSVPSGIAAVDLDGRQTYVNPAFCRMVGWSEAELVGAKPPFVYWPPEEIEAITNALGKVVPEQTPGSGIELRLRRRNGERFFVLLQITLLRNSFGDVTGLVSSALDITERKRAKTRLDSEHAITRLLANAPSLEAVAPGILDELLVGMEADLGVLWLADAAQTLLKPSVCRPSAPEGPLRAFQEATRRLSLAPGQGLAGQVWQERRAVWATTFPHQGALAERADLALKAGLDSAAAFPIHSGDQLVGVVEFFSRGKLEPEGSLQNMLTAIAGEIDQFIQRRTAEAAVRRARDELELRVQQRTADLKTANSKLQTAISERQILERELLELTEKERRRLALDLHDDLGQKLSGLALMTKGLEMRLTKARAAEGEEAAKIHTLIQQALDHTRGLAHDLAALDFRGKDLPTALGELASHARELFAVSCRFEAKGKIPPLESNAVSQLYKIAQEAVTNAVKHGKAKRVNISLTNGAQKLVLTVRNNGKPFPALKGHSPGMGLRIMSYRASLIGASLEVKGTAPPGTLVTCALPLDTNIASEAKAPASSPAAL